MGLWLPWNATVSCQLSVIAMGTKVRFSLSHDKCSRNTRKFNIYGKCCIYTYVQSHPSDNSFSLHLQNPKHETLTGNWSENEARYVFAKIKTATIMRNKIPPNISTLLYGTNFPAAQQQCSSACDWLKGHLRSLHKSFPYCTYVFLAVATSWIQPYRPSELASVTAVGCV